MKTWIDLTEGFPFKFDVGRMKSDLEQLQDLGWLSHYDVGLSTGWKAILLVSKNGQMSGPESQRPSWDFSEFRRTPVVDQLPYFKEILDAFKCPQGRMRILKLEPGSGIGLHRDVGAEVGCIAFNQVRLHVPIITNPKVTFFVGGERIQMKPGRLYYVNFSKEHFVRNDGDAPRYHLVMDVKVNDWLRQFFPPETSFEKLEHAMARATWPTFWKVRRFKIVSQTIFWRHYNGSMPQQIVHRIRGKGAAS